MQLVDGLQRYQGHPGYATFTVSLESDAQKILRLLRRHGDDPAAAALSTAKQFLIEVEKWKADCLQERMGNAAQTSEQSIWEALRGAVGAASDVDALLSVMRLKGFGSSTDEVTGQRRAKVATSVLRFLWPDRWGVVDWRMAAMLGLLTKLGWNVDRAMSAAKGLEASDLRKLYDVIDERGAREINEQYRRASRQFAGVVPRAADVDMAVFGLSLVAWPMKASGCVSPDVARSFAESSGVPILRLEGRTSCFRPHETDSRRFGRRRSVVFPAGYPFAENRHALAGVGRPQVRRDSRDCAAEHIRHLKRTVGAISWT